jgi:TnpA family transposase
MSRRSILSARLATSIKQGTATASLLVKKLSSYPRQNGLAKALAELGKIERTLFILDWLQNVDLRRRVQAGLNKGEARNALARAVFFNRLGEIRDYSVSPRPSHLFHRKLKRDNVHDFQ